MSSKNNDLKRERFKKVAAKRVQKVLSGLEGLSKCSNKNNYEYTEEDIAKMLKAIKDQVRVLEMTFSGKSKNKAKGFEF